MYTYPIICKYCGKEFMSKRKSQKYCNYNCFALDMLSKGVFRSNPSEKQKSRYDIVMKGVSYRHK